MVPSLIQKDFVHEHKGSPLLKDRLGKIIALRAQMAEAELSTVVE